MQFINYAIEGMTIASVLFYGSLFISGLAKRSKQPVIEQSGTPESFSPNPDELAEGTPEESALVKVEAETEVDPWDVEIEPITTAVLPLFTNPPRLLLLPAAKVQDWQKMSAGQLRKECQARQIRWRNANGKKHLTKQQMIKALSA